MKITFWGVRGSIPTPGPETVRVGGNTSCVEVRVGSALLVFDGGTGLRLLGKTLLAEMPLTAHIFFSHVHWDHIQGFPFFDPAFVKGNTIHLYGGQNLSRTLEETLAGQMDHPSFPVHLTDMAAAMTFNDLVEDEALEIPTGDGVAHIRTAPGNHPNGVWAYRVDYQGRSVMYATDTEHYDVIDQRLATLAQGVDVLIYDSQYTPEEYSGSHGKSSKVGWGHSTFEEAVKLAKASNAKRLVLFHHDPTQNDDSVDAKEARAKALFPNAEAAREGLTIQL